MGGGLEGVPSPEVMQQWRVKAGMTVDNVSNDDEANDDTFYMGMDE